MKAIILAAGGGKRIGIDKPKCLLEFGGKTLLQRQIDTFKECGIKDIVVVTGYKKNIIPKGDFSVMTNENFVDTDMVYSFFITQSHWREDIIVSYGDIIYEQKVLDAVIKSKKSIGVVVDENGVKYFRERFGEKLKDNIESMVIGSDEKIKQLGEKVNDILEVQGQYIGLMKFAIKGLALIYGAHCHNMEKYRTICMTDMLMDLIKDKKDIYAIKINGGWLEFDTVNDYTLYKEWVKNGSIKKYINLEEN